jgi:hypothetical protein
MQTGLVKRPDSKLLMITTSSGDLDTVVIAMRPETDRVHVAEDGTRRYRIDAEGADIDAFDPKLNEVDPGWRDHLTNWRDD